MQEKVVEVPTTKQVVVPEKTTVREVSVVQQVIEKIVERVIELPRVIEVEKVLEKIVEKQQIVELETIVPQLVKVHEVIKEYIDKIISTPVIQEVIK